MYASHLPYRRRYSSTPAASGGLGALLHHSFNHRLGTEAGPGGWWIRVELDVELELHEGYCPDLTGWRREHVPDRPRGRPVRIRPDWVCEVLSPSNRRNDLVTKMRVLHRCGVPHYWVVDPDEEVLTIHRWHEGGYLVALTATRGETVRPEPFDAVELAVGTLFGEET